jgi:hypothetical protein
MLVYRRYTDCRRAITLFGHVSRFGVSWQSQGFYSQDYDEGAMELISV